MDILVDSSVVLRFVSVDEPMHGPAASKIESLIAEGHRLVFTPQIARECWAVMTRPENANGLGLSTEEAGRLMVAVESVLHLLDDVPGIYGEWWRLVRSYAVTGKQVHDANHVAAMKAHGIVQILTLDERDFRRYAEITILKP